jgi:acetyl esterase/lipase
VAILWRIARDVFARTAHHTYGGHRQNRADLHMPRTGGPHPVVILIHGGYWRATYGKVVMKPVAADLVRRGFATWNIEYRRIGRGQGGGYPATFDDVAAAIDHLASLVDPRLDLGDVTLIGHSAGGHLALWAASADQGRVRFQRVIAQAPVCNLAKARPAIELLGGTPAEVPERYAECNPIEMLPVAIPVLLVHGAGDATIPVERSREYAEAARAAGDDVELVQPHPGGHRSHVDPRTPSWRAAVEWLEEARSSGRSTVPPGVR